MIRIFVLTVLALLTFSHASADESFEGVIKYKIEFESYHENLPIHLLEEGFGTSAQAFYKPGYMKMVFTGKQGQEHAWEVYVASENKQFLKMKSDPVPVSHDSGKETRKLKSFTDADSDYEVLGRKTRVVTIEYEDGSLSKYWYSPSIFIDPAQFQKLEFSYLNRYWEVAKSPYLRHEWHKENYKLIYTAEKISAEKLDDSLFSVE
ncbi:hypothetical protein ACG1BZ_14895 [Microbulbifer sp. CNSA002]|uniref:hypothetical protein n=1 Tax=Microbulbifer sp. CNSA002 TaxID=3373604 RepID=UPI0039B49D5A